MISRLTIWPTVKPVAGLTISAVALILVIRNLDATAIAQSIANIDLSLLFLSLLTVALTTLAKALRWRLLLGRSHVISVSAATSFIIIGQTINNLFPLRFGEIARTYLAVERWGIPVSVSLGSIALEKLVDLLFLTLSLLLVSLLLVIPTDFLQPASTSVASGILLLVAIAALTRIKPSMRSVFVTWSGFLPDAVSQGIPRQLNELRDLWHEIGRTQTIASVLAWSTIVWALAVATNHLSLQAMGMDLPLLASLVLLITIHLGIAIPSAPGRIGIFQGATLVGLAPFGVSPTMALTYSLVLHFIVFVPISIAGCGLLWRGQIGISRLTSSIPLLRDADGAKGVCEQMKLKHK